MPSKEKIKAFIAKSLNIDSKYVTSVFCSIDSKRQHDYIVENAKNISEVNPIVFKYNILFKECSFYCEFEYWLKNKAKVKNLYFEKCIFNRHIDISNIDFSYINLKECEFNDRVVFSNSTIENFLDNNSVFKDEFCLYDKIHNYHCIFKDKVEFKDTAFKKSVDFSHCVFEKEAKFKKCKFLYNGESKDAVGSADVDFSSIAFNDEVYFDQSVFNGFVAFHMTKFTKQTSFYETAFEKMPNFSPGNFGDVVYFNTTKWQHGFDFKSIEENISTAYNAKGNDADKKKEDQLKENIINFRDSCRAIKNSLIQQNNLLDAQDFHKAELYCKEIELKAEKSKSMKEWFDWGLLCFYKHTSEHHTDLNKIFHILLIVIAGYVMSLLALGEIVFYATNHTEVYDKSIAISCVMTFVCFLVVCGFLYFLYAKKRHWRLVSVILMYIGVLATLIYQPQVLNPILGISSSDERKNTKLNKKLNDINYIEALLIRNELVAKALVLQHESKNIKELVLENKNAIKKNSYITTALHNIKQAIKQDEVIYATRQSMSVIYLVLLILCIFSLQKTARKNTIVPS